MDSKKVNFDTLLKAPDLTHFGHIKKVFEDKRELFTKNQHFHLISFKTQEDQIKPLMNSKTKNISYR